MIYAVRELKYEQPSRQRIATGNDYGILLIRRGNVHVCGRWNLNSDDLLICKPRQYVTMEYPGGRNPLSVLWITVPPQLLRECSTERTDAAIGFDMNPAPVAPVRVRSEMLMLIKSLAARMVSLPGQQEEYAMDLLEEGTVKMFLALVLRACFLEDPWAARENSHQNLDDVFLYIHAHLTEEITLEQLEKEFFVSRHHLIRQFKRRTGLTVHQYIVKAKLDLCRKLVEQGMAITEVYQRGGFGSYNHFFRAFRQQYGMSPKEYYRTFREMPE